MPSASVTCGPAPTLTGPVVLATMPASFVTQTATFDATVGLLEGHLSGADTTAGLMSYFNAHRSIFDTACFTVAQYTTQADATSALTKVSSGTPFAQVAAAAGTGSGPQGCDILYGIASQLPAGTNLQTLADNKVSAPISINGSYLLLEITSRTPTSFAKATSSVHLALERLGATDAVKLLQATEKRAAVSVNPRYGTWNPTVAQVAGAHDSGGRRCVESGGQRPRGGIRHRHAERKCDADHRKVRINREWGRPAAPHHRGGPWPGRCRPI